MSQPHERRSSPRQPYAGIIDVGGAMAFAHDISRGGVSFYLRRPLAVGTVLEIAAGGSVEEPAVIRTSVVVARVDSHSRGFLVGARFPREIDIDARPAPAAPPRTRERSDASFPRPKLRRRDFKTPFLARTLR